MASCAVAQRARHRLLEITEMLDQHVHRTRIKAVLRVRQVVVVDEQQVGDRSAGQRGDLGELARDLELNPVGAHQLAIDKVVAAHGETVRPQSRVRLGRGLPDDHRAVAAIGHSDFGRQRVDLGGVEPFAGEVAQVLPARVANVAEEVGKGRVTPRVLDEVLPKASAEVVLTGIGDQLLDDARALG